MKILNKGDFNGVFTILFILSVICNTIINITSISKMLESACYEGYGLIILQTINSTMIIVSMIGILMKKIWGIYTMLGWGTILLSVEIIIPEFFSPYDFLIYVLGGGLLFIKKDGKTAWNIIWGEEEKDGTVSVDDNDGEDTQSEMDSNISNSDKEFEKLEGEIVVDGENGSNIDNSHRFSNNNTQNKNKNIITRTIVFLVISLVGAFIWYNDYNSPEKKFQRANQFFSEGKTNKAIDMLTELAEEDYTKAKLRLGLLYLFNDSIDLNSTLGLKYLKEIAVSDREALLNLLRIYRGELCKGEDFSNSDLAIFYANMAIKKGIFLDESYFTLGNAYSEQKNYELAYFYWTKATEYGSVEAYSNLGWMYFWGRGCKTNYEKAYQYFMKAYEIYPDYDFILLHLGIMYIHGYGIEADFAKGKDFIKRAADLGNEDARKEYTKLQMNEYEEY